MCCNFAALTSGPNHCLMRPVEPWVQPAAFCRRRIFSQSASRTSGVAQFAASVYSAKAINKLQNCGIAKLAAVYETAEIDQTAEIAELLKLCRDEIAHTSELLKQQSCWKWSETDEQLLMCWSYSNLLTCKIADIAHISEMQKLKHCWNCRTRKLLKLLWWWSCRNLLKCWNHWFAEHPCRKLNGARTFMVCKPTQTITSSCLTESMLSSNMTSWQEEPGQHMSSQCTRKYLAVKSFSRSWSSCKFSFKAVCCLQCQAWVQHQVIHAVLNDSPYILTRSCHWEILSEQTSKKANVSVSRSFHRNPQVVAEAAESCPVFLLRIYSASHIQEQALRQATRCTIWHKTTRPLLAGKARCKQTAPGLFGGHWNCAGCEMSSVLPSAARGS